MERKQIGQQSSWLDVSYVCSVMAQHCFVVGPSYEYTIRQTTTGDVLPKSKNDGPALAFGTQIWYKTYSSFYDHESFQAISKYCC
jgi:hypothetical protein